MGGAGWSLSVASVTRARVPSEPTMQLGQVVAGGGLHELAAGADHLAGGQHRLEAEHVVAGDPVLDGPHAAGVGGHVAAERLADLAGEDRVDEAVGGRGRASSSRQGHAGLDHGHVVVGVDLEDAAIRSKETHDPVGDRGTAAPRGRSRCPGRRPATRLASATATTARTSAVSPGRTTASGDHRLGRSGPRRGCSRGGSRVPVRTCARPRSPASRSTISPRPGPPWWRARHERAGL